MLCARVTPAKNALPSIVAQPVELGALVCVQCIFDCSVLYQVLRDGTAGGGEGQARRSFSENAFKFHVFVKKFCSGGKER